MRRDDVVVTGLGAVSPAGIGVDATWQGLCAGVPTARTDPELAGLPVDFSCAVDGFDPRTALPRRASRVGRFVQFGVAAVREALRDAGLDPAEWDADRVGVVMGVGASAMDGWLEQGAKVLEGRPETVSPLALLRSIPNMASAEIALAVTARGPNLVTSTACASGATAIGVARDLIRSGTCDIVLAGGTEAPRAAVLTSVTFTQLTALSRRRDDPAGASRPFEADRDGFVLGEGAGVLVLERAEHARGRGAVPLARLAGYGASCDAYHVTAPCPDGVGTVRAMGAALADAGLGPGDVDHVNAHGTGTRLNDLAEARAVRALFPHDPPVTAPKSVIGHAIGGAGAIEAVASVLSLRYGLVPPTANYDRPDPEIDLDVVHKVPRPIPLMRTVLSNSCGFGGHNAALLFTAG
ncbi:beta-ketoacyl-[acyl-carrier-protein] synthase family protein [Streptomyces coeruleoprunus]|uniref:Beta-ketoacyl-[acyl-carrier-protein] synthase family protein n=1 Tax=Streptomyces coeruleoprunus TaxID=285563 RepID=A0ABV9XHY5_9ACTN